MNKNPNAFLAGLGLGIFVGFVIVYVIGLFT